jgi:hypothetical protein
MPAKTKFLTKSLENPSDLLGRCAASTVSLFIAFLSITYCLFIPLPALADLALLGKQIAEYNLEQVKKSLTYQSYRGEEGILRLNPVVGKTLGIKVIQDQDYLMASELYKEARESYKSAVNEMKINDADDTNRKHAKNVAIYSARYNKAAALAWGHMMVYRSKLTPVADDRLNDEICFKLLERLILEELEKASYNLREALGNLWNRCQGLEDSPPLNTSNIGFVNSIFSGFTKTASEDALNKFNLDTEDNDDLNSMWKLIMEESCPNFIPVFENAFGIQSKEGCPVNQLLFLALVRQESNFNPRGVSYMGAAGLTQIMPATALELGMKAVFTPAYFKEAQEQLRLERGLKKKATDQIFLITSEDSIDIAVQAIALMRESLACGERRHSLFTRYRLELLQTGSDERLAPGRALDCGLRYFSKMMNMQKGDISLALASYNAGPQRVSQYNGIPPFEETIDFRNKVISYYREYKSRIKKHISQHREALGR